MARVRKPNPRPKPIYPTSGRIHILVEWRTMMLAYLSERSGLSQVVHMGKTKGVERVPRFGSADSRKEKGSPEKVHWRTSDCGSSRILAKGLIETH